MPTVIESLERAVRHHEAGELEQAERLYRDVIRLDPKHADALNLLGVSLHQRRQNDAAVKYISQAIEINAGAAMYHSNLGAAYRASGQVDKAVDCFESALRIDRTFAGAHYNLAMALESLGQTVEAMTSYRDAIHFDPKFAGAYNNLGRLYASTGRLDEAVKCFQKYVEADPKSARALYNLANGYAADRQMQKSIETYQQALELAPNVAEIHNNLGAALKEIGEYDSAAQAFEKALAIQPDFSDARSNLKVVMQLAGRGSNSSPGGKRGVSVADGGRADHHVALASTLRQAGRYEEAEAHYRVAIEIDPNLVDAHFGLGFVELSNGRHDLACARFEEALRIDPQHAPSLTNLGSIYSGRDELEKAADCYRRILQQRPDDAINHYNLATVYKDQWRLTEAEQEFRQAIKINPEFVPACINLGVVLQRQGRMQESLQLHERARRLSPTDAEARFHLSLALLHAGEYARGWDDYESRWEYEATTRDFNIPTWDETQLARRRLLVYAEQGVGDEIMFASCLPDVIGQTTSCVVECDPRLVPLFARSFPLAEIVSRPFTMEDNRGTSRCDCQVAMGSLPRFLRRRIDDFPKQRRFLNADARAVEKWRRRYAELGSGLKVGISWRGGNNASIRRSRSSLLETWQPILSCSGAQFINLQYGETKEEIAACRRTTGASIHDWHDANPLVDLDDFAAQISALDLVISVDNSTVHMAGALGVDVWTLLPFSPNWRWMLDRDDSPWYSTMRLFRQPVAGDWSTVFNTVSKQLQEKAGPAADRTQKQKPEHVIQTVPATHADEADRERRKYEAIWTHNDYRRFSPGLHDADKVPLIDTLRKHGVQTVLDAGCGSGKLMRRLMTEHRDEFDVHGFDISSNCLDPFFKDIVDEVLTLGCLWNPVDFCVEYDAIICTDVLEHIPTEHVPAVLANFRRCTQKVCYLAIALFPDNFGPALLGEPLHLTVQPPNWWFEQFASAGLAIESQGVEKSPEGRDLWLHAFLRPAQSIAKTQTPLPLREGQDFGELSRAGEGVTPRSHVSQTKTVLHVGCGPKNSEGLHERFRGADWKEVRLDIDPRVKPDIVASLTDLHVIETSSVDAVWSSHNIEHLHAHEVPLALAEFHRVLKPGGMALVTLPDLQEIARFVVADKLEEVAYISPAGPITPLDCIFGFGKPIAAGNGFMAHKTGFTASSLKRALEQAGFVAIRIWSASLALWAEAIKR